MSDAPRRLSRLGGNKSAFPLLKATPNIPVVRKKGSLNGKVDLLPAVPTELKEKKRKTADNQGKLKKPFKARASFVPPAEFRHQKQKNSTTAVMPISRQTPAQLQLAEEVEETVAKLDVDYQYPPLQLPFKPPASFQSPLLSALSPRLLPLPAPNNSWLDFALEGSQLFRAHSLPTLPSMASEYRAQLTTTGNDQLTASSPSTEQLMLGYSPDQSLSAVSEQLPHLDQRGEPPLLCPMLESYSDIALRPPITRQKSAPPPAPRHGYIKQENGLAKLLFRSDALDSGPHHSSLMFIQLPTSLPITTTPSVPISKPTTDKQILAQKINEIDKSGTEGTSLKKIPPGFMGNITLYKSGKMALQLGGVGLNAEPGTRKTFREEVMSISPETGECFPLGSISNRVIFSMNIDSVT